MALFAWWEKLRAAIGQLIGGRRAKDGKGNQGDDAPLTALVLLLREPRYLEQPILAHTIEKSWGLDFADTDSDATEFLVGETPAFIAQTRLGTFLINNFPVPYVSNVEEVAQSIGDLRTRKAFLDHRAWLSVDLLHTDERSGDPAEAYRWIGRLIATLIDEDCLGVLCPGTNQILPIDPGLEDRLRSDDVLRVMGQWELAPIVEMPGGDARMEAAVAEARRRWPEFEAAFELREPDQPFIVKAPFATSGGESSEYMWVSVESIEGGLVRGKLENEPLDVPNLKLGSRVQVKVEDVNDWLFGGESTPTGGFTLAAINEQMRRPEQ